MATERRVTFLIGANIQNFQKNLNKAQRRFSRFGRKMQRTGRDLSRTVTAPVVATAGAAVKAAADFESSFADIRKTVNATDAEFASMQKQMRNLAKEIPTSVNELNRLGGVAGQLGIANDNIVDFSKTIAMLGDTTDIAGEQAALSLSRFMNVMGTAQSDVDRLGSTIVGLGNNFAAMESEIVEAATSLAPLGNSIGLTEQQVLAFSTTIAASGGKVEAASTAFQKTANTMKQAVIEGNEDLKVFAETAGVTASEFQRAFRDDAAGALQLFLKGLRRVQKEGGSTATVLDKVGLADQRLVREFGKVLGNLDDLDAALGQANLEWERNTALTEEAQQRYSTFNSRLQKLWNRIYDLGITIGNTLIPVIENLIDHTEDIISYFDGLDESLIRTGVAVAIAAAALGPLLWIFGTLSTAIGSVIGALSSMLGPMGAVGLVGAGAADAIVRNWDKLKAYFSSGEGKQMWVDVKNTIAGVVAELVVLFKEMVITISTIWQRWGNDIVKLTASVMSSIKDTLGGLANFFSGVLNIMQGDWVGFWIDILQAASSVLSRIKPAIAANLSLEAAVLEAKYYKSTTEETQRKVRQQLDKTEQSIQKIISAFLTANKAQKKMQLGPMAGFNQMMAINPNLGQGLGQESQGMNIMGGLFTDVGNDVNGLISQTERAKRSFQVMGDAFTPVGNSVQDVMSGMSEKAKVMGQALQSTATSAITSFAETLGNAFTGDAGAEGFFNNLLLIVVEFANRFGKLLIGAGIAAQAFQNLLANPIAAIIAGTALVAATTAVKNLLKKGPGDSNGNAENTTSVNDALVRSDGSIVQFHPNDDILAMQDFGNLQMPAVQSRPEGTIDVTVSGQFTQKGTDLVAIIKKAKAGPLR